MTTSIIEHKGYLIKTTSGNMGKTEVFSYGEKMGLSTKSNDMKFAENCIDSIISNEKLAVSAPELLEACKQFLRYADSGNHPKLTGYAATIVGSKMRVAVSKAEGK